MNIAATNATGKTATDIQAKRRDRLASGGAAGTGTATGLAGLDMLTSLFCLHGPQPLRTTARDLSPATTRSDSQPPRTHHRTCKPLGTRGGSAPPPSARPLAFGYHKARTRTVSMPTQAIGCVCSPREMLSYRQPWPCPRFVDTGHAASRESVIWREYCSSKATGVI